MKFGRFAVLLLLVLLNIILLSGCWNYYDIEKYSIVTGMAIDKNEEGNKYLVTVEVIDFEMSGKEAKSTPKLIESEGDTIFGAISNMTDVTGKKLYWGHAKIVIVSQNIAREGIAPVMDYTYRDPELREEMSVVISKEKTAKELLEQETLISEMSAFEIENVLKSEKTFSKSPKAQIFELVNDIDGEGISSFLPAIGITTNMGKKTTKLMGTAVFKTDKLVGFLDEDESEYCLFITNQIDKGILTQKESPENQMSDIALKIFKSKTRVKPEYSDGKLGISIDIKTEVSIAEVETSVDYIAEKGRQKLKKDAEESLKSSVENVIKKVQNDYDSDIFGFGKLVKADMPSLWKEIEPDWNNLFRKLDINVSVDITIRNSALVSKTIKRGD